MNGAVSSFFRANVEAWPDGFPRPPAADPRGAGGERGAMQDSVGAAEHLLATIDVASSRTLLVIGLGLGYVLDVLDRRGWTGRVVAFEPEPALVDAWLRRRDWREWLASGRLTILLGPSYQGLDRVVPSLDPERADPVVVVNHAVAATCVDASKDALRIAARAWFGARANQAARRQNAGRYLLNSLRNVRALAAEGDAAALAGGFTGVPGLVVGAGPSLDRNLPEIVRHRDRLLIVAADTALRPLLSAGVPPHFVVAVDPSEANARHLTDLPSCPDTHLVAEGSLDPEALRHFAGRTFFFRVADHHPWPWLKSVGIDRGRLRAWGSVLTTAFDLALTMGCDPIVFAGADLAFTDGRPYARGTTFEEDWRREQAWGQTLEQSWAARLGEWPEVFENGVDGAPVRTAPHLRSFRDWIVSEASKATGRTVVNATGRGILGGDGVRPGTLAEMCAARPSLPPSIREAIGLRYRDRARASVHFTSPLVSDEVQRNWIAFAGVPADAITGALQARPRAANVDLAPSRVDRFALPDDPAAEPTNPVAVNDRAAGERLDHGLSETDAVYLAGLAQTTSIQRVALTDPSQDLLAVLRRESRDLRFGQALVVIDDVGIAVGAQVRRAADALLCERPDLWLECRRFVDHGSRLTVIRGDAARWTPPAIDADAVKWDPAHQAVAESLAPIVAGHLTPTSVVDLGCGAGYWLNALATQGVATVRGITPRPDGDPVVPDLIRAPLDAIPDLGRRFDVCLCLEVVQRLPPDAQDALIAACARLSDVVVFSSRVPGCPDSSPHDRPMPYWAAKFWRHGYVFDDAVRRLIEGRWNFPRTVFDGLLVFRRQFTPAQAADPSLSEFVLASAARAYDPWVQSIWWAVLASDRLVPEAPPPPRSPMTSWVIPPARLAPASGSMRVFRFRTDAARWYLTHPACAISVLEDGQPLPDIATAEGLASAATGGWVRWRDEVTIKASDGSDPRTNGRQHTLVLPSHVAWAESQPLTDGLHGGWRSFAGLGDLPPTDEMATRSMTNGG